MQMVKFSDYVKNGIGSNGDIQKLIKAEMDRLDELKQNWSILIDVDWPLNDVWTMYIKDDGYPRSDYDYLDSIDVASNVSKFKSINGCLVDKDGYLVFAPKNKRTTAIDNIGIVGIQKEFNLTVWNEVNSKVIRTNISQFASNDYYSDPYKDYFEKLLMLYKENIYENIFDVLFKECKYDEIPGGLCNSEFQHIPSKDIFVDKITLSRKIMHAKYGLDVKYEERKYEEDPEYRYDKEPKMDDNIKKDPYAKDSNDDLFAPFSTLIYGEYYQDKHEIILYVEAMKRSGKTGRDLEDLFLSVLIHEFFHAVHHTYCDKYGNKRPFNENNDIIVESLAASFEYFFCENVLGNKKLISEMKNTWNKHSVLIYPYSGAKQIITSRHNHELTHNLHNIMHAIHSVGKLRSNISRLLIDIDDSTRYMPFYTRSYFLLSLISMKQAQMDLLTRCL